MTLYVELYVLCLGQLPRAVPPYADPAPATTAGGGAADPASAWTAGGRGDGSNPDDNCGRWGRRIQCRRQWRTVGVADSVPVMTAGGWGDGSNPGDECGRCGQTIRRRRRLRAFWRWIGRSDGVRRARVWGIFGVYFFY